jgi:hypothetical protein
VAFGDPATGAVDCASEKVVVNARIVRMPDDLKITKTSVFMRELKQQ